MKNIALISLIFLCSCQSQTSERSDRKQFEEILNDPRINSKEVGEREGIKMFQVMENGKTGFRDLDGNVVIKPVYDFAEMFSEGLSTVKVGKKYGLIDEKGNYVLSLREYEYLGSVHNGLASFRSQDKYGFINVQGVEVIKPQFEWVDEFSEGLCVVRNAAYKQGFIDTKGKLVINYQFSDATKFENGRAKVMVNDLWGAIDNTGKIIEPIKHDDSSW
jgi:hypothetical protein